MDDVTRRALLASMCCLAAWWCACASLEPLVEVLPPELSPPNDTGDEARPLRVSVREARPNGVLLELTVGAEAGASWRKLEIWRSVDDTPARLLHELGLDPKRREALAGGVPLLDRDMRPEGRYAYQLRLIGGEDATLESEVLRLTWAPPPGAPQEVTATALGARAVELRWTPRPGQGALIFRRDLLDARGRLERLSTAGPEARGVFIDRDVTPGGLYAYRVSLARLDGDYPAYGPPGPELYVTLAEGDARR